MNRLSPSFLDSFAYYLSIEDEDAADARRLELIARLKGEELPPNEAMLNGQKYEKDVMDAVCGIYKLSGDVFYDSCVFDAAKIIDDSIYQYHVQAELDGVLIHGYIDFLNGNHLYDTKFVVDTPDIGKYRNSNQHKSYLFCCQAMNITNFTYLIADGKQLYKEFYQWKPSFVDDLKSNIRQFFDYLSNDSEMELAYKAKMERLDVEKP
jgi:hypothetical protein